MLINYLVTNFYLFIIFIIKMKTTEIKNKIKKLVFKIYKKEVGECEFNVLYWILGGRMI